MYDRHVLHQEGSLFVVLEKWGDENICDLNLLEVLSHCIVKFVDSSLIDVVNSYWYKDRVNI